MVKFNLLSNYMLESTTMTYLIVGNNEENIKKRISDILSESWGKEISMNIFDSQHPDLHILNGEGKNSIGIEDVKNLQCDMMFTPFEESIQAAVINQAEKLTIQAQNSILKTLEESSDTTIYFLIVNNERSLLPTILSRSRKIYTKTEKEVSNNTENVKNILGMDLVDAFKYVEEVSKEKAEVENLLKDMEHFFQGLLEESIRSGDGYKNVAQKIDLVRTAQKRIKANGNKKLVLENLFIHLKDNL